MLKERQLHILSDLENTKVFISAKALTTKYDVSLRTIRSDIEEIAYEVKRLGGTLLRVPHKGMRIECSTSIYQALMDELALDSFSILDKEQQFWVLLSVFLIKENPVTVNFLSEAFDVSPSTMTSRLKALEEFLAPYKVTLSGVKKKGYYLGGTQADIERIASAASQALRADVFSRFFAQLSPSNSFVDESELQLISLTVNFLSDELDISPLDSQRISIPLLYIIKNNQSMLFNRLAAGAAGDTRVSQLEPQFNLLLGFLNERLAQPLSPLWERFLRHVLLHFTNAPSQLRFSAGGNTPKNLDLAVHRMVEASLNYFPELSEHREELEKDLLTHISSIINRIGANLDVVNPLLEEIQIRFSLIFSTVKELSKTFTMYYPMLLDDNQISYLVLYFAEYLEKASEQVPLRLLVVCNSGAGVAKLLSTRLRNHFPEILTIEHASSYQIESGKIPLEDVDLIVTTISLRNPPDIPAIMTSPFLTNDEQLQIRKLLIEITQAKSHTYRLLNAASSSSLLQVSSGQGSSLEFDFDRNILLAEILTEAFAMFREIYPEGITAERYSVVTGILTHIVMSIPRWTTGEFIKAYDLDELRLAYPKEFATISACLDRIGEQLGIFIAPVEAVAILRYMINDW